MSKKVVWITFPKTHWFGSRKYEPEKRKFYELYYWMIARCTKVNHSSYNNYWWRWIKCLRKTFEEFKDDMYEWYVIHIKQFWRKNTLLDRIDNDWDYCKENCRWVTRAEQNSNQRRSIYTIIDWKKYTSRDIADMCWLCIDWAWDRIRKYNNWLITKDKLFRYNPKKTTLDELKKKH